MPLKTASFKGILFQVAEHGFRITRRIAQYDMANATLPINEDLGRQARSYQIQAWLLGENTSVQRDRLLQACSVAGPGVLIHPYLGLLRVHCERAEVIENSQENRLVRLNLNFIEAGSTSVSVIGTHTIPIGAAIEQAIAASQQNFLDTNVVSTPQILEASLLQLTESLQTVAGSLSYPGVVTAGLMDALNLMNLQAANLASTPADLAAIIPLAIQAFSQTSAPLNATLKSYQQMISLSPENYEAPVLVNLAQDSALIESVKLLAGDNDEQVINSMVSEITTSVEQRLLQTNTYHDYKVWDNLQRILMSLKQDQNISIHQVTRTEPWLVFVAQHYSEIGLAWENYQSKHYDYPAWVHSGEAVKLPKGATH